MTRRVPWLRRRAAAPSIRSGLLFWAFSLFVLSQASKPLGLDIFTGLPCVVGLFMALAVAGYAARIIAVIVNGGVSADGPPATSARHVIRWGLPVCGIAFLLSMNISDWPLRARFALSRAGLERVAQACLADTHTDMGHQIIGLYWVRRIELNGPGEVAFVTGSSFDATGFAFDRSNRPAGGVNQKIAVNWYAVEW